MSFTWKKANNAFGKPYRLLNKHNRTIISIYNTVIYFSIGQDKFIDVFIQDVTHCWFRESTTDLTYDVLRFQIVFTALLI